MFSVFIKNCLIKLNSPSVRMRSGGFNAVGDHFATFHVFPVSDLDGAHELSLVIEQAIVDSGFS